MPGEEKANELLSGFFAGWVTALLNLSSSGFVHACVYTTCGVQDVILPLIVTDKVLL